MGVRLFKILDEDFVSVLLRLESRPRRTGLVPILSVIREQGTGNREQGTGNREQGRNFFLVPHYLLPITHYPLPIT
jgi:hypothetical protein